MDLFKGVLLKVQDNDFKALIFEHKKFDHGLGREVECSVSVMIPDEYKSIVSELNKFVNKEIYLPVSILVTKKNTVLRIMSDIPEVVQNA